MQLRASQHVRPQGTAAALRVLIVSDTSGYMRGGVPAATRRLIDGLRRHGHVVGLCSDTPLSDDPTVSFFAWNIFDAKELGSRLSAAIDSFAPDIVHVISMSSKGLLVAMPLLAGRPWLLTCHSIPPYERKLPLFHAHERLHYSARWLRFLANSLAWRYLFAGRGLPHIVVHSEWVAAIARRYGHAATRTTLVPLGNAPDRSAPPMASRQMGTSAAPMVVTVGGIAHTKGQHDALAAIAKVRRAFPGVQYRMIGETRDSSYLEWLKSLIDRWDLAPNVQILSTLSSEDKQIVLSSADVYLQPSHEEGFCLAFLEAAACVPRLVATAAGAMRAICGDDPAARIVPVRAPEAMAGAIEFVLAAELPPGAMQARLDRLDRDFGWQQYTDAHEKLYRSLVGHPR